MKVLILRVYTHSAQEDMVRALLRLCETNVLAIWSIGVPDIMISLVTLVRLVCISTLMFGILFFTVFCHLAQDDHSRKWSDSCVRDVIFLNLFEAWNFCDDIWNKYEFPRGRKWPQKLRNSEKAPTKKYGIEPKWMARSTVLGGGVASRG